MRVSHVHKGDVAKAVMKKTAAALAVVSLVGAGFMLTSTAANAAADPGTTTAAVADANPSPDQAPVKPAPVVEAPATIPSDDNSNAPTEPAKQPTPQVTAKTSNDNGGDGDGHNNPPKLKKEAVALYIYPLLDSSKEPSWSNSGLQTKCASKDGTEGYTSVNCTLPPEVCGKGWAYQEDWAKNWTYEGAFNWPTHIQYPIDNIGWPPIYAAKHGHLSELMSVPPCAPPVHTKVTLTYTSTTPVCNVETHKVESANNMTLNGHEGAIWTYAKGTDKQTLAAGAGFNAAPPFGVGTYTITGTDADANDLIDVAPVTATLTFVSADSIECAAPPVDIHPGDVWAHDSCGITDDSTNTPGKLDPESLNTSTDKDGNFITNSEYVQDNVGGFRIADKVAPAGLHTSRVIFQQFGNAKIAEPIAGVDTYILVKEGNVTYAQWDFTFDSTPCPLTIIATPPAPTKIPATCTANGSLPPAEGGEGYTAAYIPVPAANPAPGDYKLVFTAKAGITFKDGLTASYDVPVDAKLTTGCPTTVVDTHTSTTGPLAFTGAKNVGETGAWGLGLLALGGFFLFWKIRTSRRNRRLEVTQQ
ncbi:MAG TPA: hypothetical protein VIM37_00040 [Candidatus Microsaccharimonas sp.]|jgi:hypothetical protein